MLEVRLLGQFEVLRDGQQLGIPTRNAQSLFAFLVLNAGTAHRRERLAGLLWPDSSEENARSNLRHELWRLRKVVDQDMESLFLVDNLTIAINPQCEYFLDVQVLESEPLVGDNAASLMEALSYYKGELLPGFYDEWVSAERERVRLIFESRMAYLLEVLQTERRWQEVQEWATRWVALDPLTEQAYKALIIAYANIGDIPKAIATYERYTLALQKDLGVMPTEQLQALYKQLKTGWKIDNQVQVPTSVTQAQISPLADTSPMNALPRVRHSNLPKPLTSFIGREKEILQVESMISNTRLITITGAGGIGKTRLAIQVAGGLSTRFRDGVWWIELASLYQIMPSKQQEQLPEHVPPIPQTQHVEPVGLDLILQAVGKALRIPESPSLPPLEGIVGTLRDKQLLLIMDNCEHIIEACAYLVERLLSDCPQVTILTTSRESLGVPGEKAWPIPSLSLPEPGLATDDKNTRHSESVNLFIERAADVLPGYQTNEMDMFTIAQICTRLEGIPLAIELAAARMNLLSAQEIASRLDRRFSLLTGGHRTALPRHQTLQAAIEWSYDLLSEADQVLFHRLAIFTGSFSLEAAEAICASQEIPGDEILTLIGRLVDKSLLMVVPATQEPDVTTRYRFLDTIRSFARMKLDEAGETRWMRDRHADYYVRLVEAAEPKLISPDHVYWFKLLHAEHDNLRAVVDWSDESDQADSALRLVGALPVFWWSFSYRQEGLDVALMSLAITSATKNKVYRAKALNTAAFLQWVLRDSASARKSLEEALSILRASGDESNLAWSMQILGLVHTSEGEYDLADKALKEVIDIAQNLGELNKSSLSLVFQGDIALQQGDHSKAKSVYEENAMLLREIGNVFVMAYPIRRLGYLALEENDILKAWDYFHESLDLNRRVGDKRAVCACLTSLAALAIHLGKPIPAARIYGVVESRLESLSMNLLYLDQIELERTRSKLLGCLDEATFTAAFSEGWEMSEEQTIELVKETFEDSVISPFRPQFQAT